MRELKHQRIIANAGSGKTYRLTRRYIELLARDVPAERIIALTFTRKAAGEFLDAIFQRLLKAATDPVETAKLADEIGQPELTESDFLRFLHQLIAKLPQLALGTLDGFFGRIIRVFPFECGLAGEITILDPHFQDVTRRVVLGHVFRAHGASEKSFRELLELLRQQSRNRQSRSVVATLDAEVRSLHEKFLLTPEGREWGDVESIWPDGMTFPATGQLSVLLDEFESQLFILHPDMLDKHRIAWEERIEMLRRLRPGYDVPEKAATFALRVIDPPSSTKHPDCFELKVGNKPFAFPNRMLRLVESMGRAILGIDLYSRIERSTALYHLLSKFEEAYQGTVRAAGKLTFMDITGLLAGGRPWGGRTLGVGLRQAVDYRLDATYDHWLLDEFQDTSRLQWQAVRDLVDEVVQSDSGQRSFFYVGDTKQAIYSWRGGDPRLFDEIASYYNASTEERIDTSESLNTSYRSKPEILDGVNGLFDPDHLRSLSAEMDFPPAAIEHWRSAWRGHIPSDARTGQAVVRWQTFAVEEGTAGELLDLETARLLEEIQPGKRGWTCAVLVHTNKRIGSVVNALRQVGLPAAAEGRLFPCVDNELASALLALLRMIAHPTDTLARTHVMMSPLAVLLGENADEFCLRALASLRAQGVAETVRQWLPVCELEQSTFLRHRAETFLEAAAAFDETTARSATVDEFIDYARTYSVTESGVAGVIRVMTMHASKGLDFDIVVLPEIQGVSLPSRRDDSSIHLHTSAGGRVQWGLELPPKAICEVDPILGRAYEEDVVEDCYEKFCLYYVALTRAKRGLYLLSTRQSEGSKSHDFNRLLHLTFPEGHWTLGNLDWFHQVKPAELKEEAELPPMPVVGHSETVRTVRRPSSTHLAPKRFPAAVLLEPSNLLGNEIHTALAQIEWVASGSRLALPTDLSPEARELLGNFLRTDSGRSVFREPGEPARLWREKSFDVLIEGQRVSGIFDRVAISESRAELVDFETDEAPASQIREAHEAQLLLYRKSLAVLLGWPEEQISCRIACVRSGEILEVGIPRAAPLEKKVKPAKMPVVEDEQPDLFGLE